MIEPTRHVEPPDPPKVTIECASCGEEFYDYAENAADHGHVIDVFIGKDGRKREGVWIICEWCARHTTADLALKGTEQRLVALEAA